MLVISRQELQGTTLVHGTTVMRVIVAEISGNKVKLAFECPAEVVIVRDELLEEKRGAA